VAIRKTNITFFLLGISVFGYLVYRFGIDQIVRNIQQAGWSLLMIIAIWLVIYLLNAVAWRLVLGVPGKDIRFGRLFKVTVSGFVINYITPFIALGGEPYKIKTLAEDLGQQQSISAVVLYRMVHLLGHMFLLLTGILAAIFFLEFPAGISAVLGLCALAIVIVILMTLAGHRGGIFRRLESLLGRFRKLERIRLMFKNSGADALRMDEIITHAYRTRPGTFWTAVLLEYGSRILMGVEVYCILYGVGIQTTIVSAIFLYVSYSIVINVLFFVPLNLGAREGGLALGLGSLALPPLLGVYLGIVMRIREFFWILIGLLFLLVASGGNKRTSGDAA
jgi:uncharacterized protein (TIRG00374 family)